MKLHQRGLDLLLNVQDAIDHLNELTDTEIRALLAETEIVLRDLLARDIPLPDGALTQDSWEGLGRGSFASPKE